jgi:methionyl-tRNA formyltransferase
MARFAFDALASRFRIVGEVTPGSAHGSALSVPHGRFINRGDWRRSRLDLARVASIPLLACPRRAQDGVAATLRTLEPDLIVVATFAYLLEPAVLSVPRIGAINLHPSLLPRHRGPDPLFWTYIRDDAETGVTVHWMDAGADTGPIIFQEQLALARGRAALDLYADLAARGAALLVRSVEAIAADAAPRTPQDERRATREPRPDAAARRIEFASWNSARAWHVLAGLGSRWGALLHDAGGRPLRHGAAVGFTVGRSERAPGTVERGGRHWRLHCADGVVTVARESPLQFARALLSALTKRVF